MFKAGHDPVNRLPHKGWAAAAMLACVWLCLPGCGGSSPPPAPVPKPPVGTKPPAASKTGPAAPVQPATPASTQAVPPATDTAAPAPPPAQPAPPYTYVAGNRRDPFRSIIVAKGKEAAMDLVHPLQQYAVKDLKLVAIVWGQLGASAMLQTPDGKGYTVKIGTAVGNRDGVVSKIKPDQIVIKERYTDIFGERKDESVVLDLHLPEEGLK